jgi:hypothetical protein
VTELKIDRHSEDGALVVDSRQYLVNKYGKRAVLQMYQEQDKLTDQIALVTEREKAIVDYSRIRR